MTSMELLKAMAYLDEELILETEKNAGRVHRRVFSRPVLIAAVIVAAILLITACTAMGGTVKILQYFSEAAPGHLSAGQVEYIVANTRDVNKSITVNGYTMTLRSVFSDGRDILLQLDLTAPLGVTLDADGYSDSRGVILESEGGYPLGMSMQSQLQDEDRSDNKVSLLYSIESAWGGKEPFTDNNCRFYIYGLEAVWRENMMNRSEVLTEGCWSYDIHFPEDCARSISFVQEPVTVYQTVTLGYEKTGDNTMMPIQEQQQGHITSLKLWALGAELAFRFGEESRNAEFGDLYVVLKNGEKIRLNRSFGMPDLITYKVDTPILLDDVVSMELEDGTRFPVP